jgi:hypothetical protein
MLMTSAAAAVVCSWPRTLKMALHPVRYSGASSN